MARNDSFIFDRVDSRFGSESEIFNVIYYYITVDINSLKRKGKLT